MGDCTRDRVVVEVYTARPGVVIGRRGSEAERLRAGLEKIASVMDRAIEALPRQVDRERALEALAMAEGLICYPAGIALEGRMVPHVMLAPPMIATPGDLESCVARLSAAVDAVFGSR